ncbi:hypothetical protein LZ554_004269 [Drepanopeziza brunnea f. sp. 'monogermtubi']|nr:hypothetical protein LZ554_004269 [Drepanopeziza brunnea f. sp. 'monogermtubi']
MMSFGSGKNLKSVSPCQGNFLSDTRDSPGHEIDALAVVKKICDGKTFFGIFQEMMDMSTAPEPLTTFTCFKKLPAELRIKVWRVASFTGRNIDLSIHSLEEVDDFWTDRVSDEEDQWPHFFFSTSKPPAILYVNMESRTEARKHYSLEFSTEFHGFELPPKIYVNWAADRICLFGPSFENFQITRLMFGSQPQYFRQLFFEKGARSLAFDRSFFVLYRLLSLATSIVGPLEELILFQEEPGSRCRERANASEISFTDVDSVSVWPPPWNTAEAFFDNCPEISADRQLPFTLRSCRINYSA